MSVCLLVAVVRPAKTAEPIEMPLCRLTHVGPRNNVLSAAIRYGSTHAWKNVFPCGFFFRVFICPFHQLGYRSHFWAYFNIEWLRRRTFQQLVLFWFWMIYGVKFAKTYRNHCIDSSHILHNDKDHHLFIVDGPNTCITNPRWQTAAIFKTLNHHISATGWPITTNDSHCQC